MTRVTEARAHFPLEEVKDRMRHDAHPLYRQRWMIIYQAMVDPRTAEEIAKHCGVTKYTVQKLISRYNRYGISAVETRGKGGRRKEYLTWEQEQQFLEPFFLRAKAGEAVTCVEIQRALETRLAHTVHKSTITRLLQRHNWRKPVPQPRPLRAQSKSKKHGT